MKMCQKHIPFIAAFILFLGTAGISAQNQEPANVPYQIPQIIYIGDRGKLVYPLDAFFFTQQNEIIPLDAIEQNDAIVIHAIEINNGRLIIDFQPFKTGDVVLPPIVIGNTTFDNLTVSIASLLNGTENAAVLSPAAAPVAAPGTFWIITAALVVIIFVICAALIFFLRGSTLFSMLAKRYTRKKIVRLTQKTIKKLRLQLEKNTVSPAAALTGITNELRIFLDRFFEVNCRSMVPSEFLGIAFPADAMPNEKYSHQYFYDFFMRCDTIRFNGEAIDTETVNQTITEVEAFVRCAGRDTGAAAAI